MSWVVTQDDRNMYAKAKREGADEIILASRESVEIFLQPRTVIPPGNPTLPSFSFLSIMI